MHHDADVTERLGGLGQVLEHPLPGAVEALHVADLHDLSGCLARLDDPVCVGERDAHRLLDEDVEPLVDRSQRHLGMGLRRRADHDCVELRPVQQLSIVRVRRLEVVTLLQGSPDRRTGVDHGDELEPVAHLGEKVEMHRLSDEPAADDADPEPHRPPCGL